MDLKCIICKDGITRHFYFEKNNKKRSFDEYEQTDNIFTNYVYDDYVITNKNDKNDKNDKNNKTPPKKRQRIRKNKEKDTSTDENNNDDNNDDNIPWFIPFLIPPSYTERNITPKPPVIVDICKNPDCNHLTFEEDPTEIRMPDISEVKDINDLITLGKTYHCKKNREYRGINLRLLCNLVPPLTELKNLIGLKNVKNKMVDQILFFLQGYHTNTRCGKCTECSFNKKCTVNQDNMLHTVITGPPGVGKTELGKILGKVYKEMGILSKGTFKLVTRSDLIAGYLGQTAIKTQKVIDECEGGVMFIDEAYSLGHKRKDDSFSKECIDTLTQNLTEKRNFLCIIAGYKEEIDACFFKMNQGLRRRFTFRYDLIPYYPDELLDMFELKVANDGFTMPYDATQLSNRDLLVKNIQGKDDRYKNKDKPTQKSKNEEKSLDQLKTDLCKNEHDLLFEKVLKLFIDNMKYLPNFGGDIETLLLNCKIIHSRDLTRKPEDHRKFSVNDIKRAFSLVSEGRDYDNETDKPSPPPVGLYT